MADANKDAGAETKDAGADADGNKDAGAAENKDAGADANKDAGGEVKDEGAEKKVVVEDEPEPVALTEDEILAKEAEEQKALDEAGKNAMSVEDGMKSKCLPTD